MHEDWRIATAQNVRRIRKDKGLTQVQLGETSGIPQSTISKIERRGEPLSFHNLYRIAHGLGVTIVDIIPHHSNDATGDLG